MRKAISLCLLFLAAFAAKGQVLLSESFNVTSATTAPPTGWTVSGSGTNVGCNAVTWEQVPSGGFVCSATAPAPNPTAQSGSGMAGYNSWDISIGGESEIVSPSLNFSALGTYMLSFWVYNQQTFYEHDSLRVFVNTSPSSIGGTMLYAADPNYNSTPTGWVQYTFNIPVTYTSTTNYIIFRGYSRYGYDIFFDDVEVDHIPPTACSGTPLTPNVSNPVITSPLCTGSTQTLNGVDPNLPTTSGITYQWQSATTSAGPWSNVTTGTGATTLTYTTSNLSNSTYYRIGATCTASTITSYSTAYFVPIGAPQPGIISGPTTFCPGDDATYSVPLVSGTTYTWTLPSGWSGSSTTNSILVTPGTTAGSIAVTASTLCGTSIPQTGALVPGSAPASPGIISGNNNICFGSTQTYSIAPVSGAVSYRWTLPSGWTGSSTTNSITITANSTPGNVTVQAMNGCGQSGASTLAVNVILSLANPGTITGKDTVCSGALEAYSITPVLGATSYVWTLPSGWSGTTTDTSVLVFAGTTGGTISVTAYVACATSPSSSKALYVITTVTPSVTISAPPGNLCQGSPITITATPSYPGTSPSYEWKKNGVDVFAFGNTYTSSTLVLGDVITVVLTSNAVCASTSTATSNAVAPVITSSVTPGVSINTIPAVVICKGTPLTFYTTSAGTGAAPSYQWYKNGIPVPAATATTYTDAGLNNNDTLTVSMVSTAVCVTVPSAISNKVGVQVNDGVVPMVSISVSPSNVPLPGQLLTFTATQSNGGATPDYQWLKNGVNIPFETGDTYASSTLAPGDHISVKMLSYDPCASPKRVGSNEIVLKSALGVAAAGGVGDVKLYPNPTSGRFTVATVWSHAYTGSQVRVDVLSAVGQVVHRVALIPPSGNSWQTDVNLPVGIANGRYMLRISTEDGSMKTTLPFILNR